jgi:hypothetical protein
MHFRITHRRNKMNKMDAVRNAVNLVEDDNRFTLTIVISYNKSNGWVNVGSPGCKKANPIGSNVSIIARVCATMRFVSQMVEVFFKDVEKFGMRKTDLRASKGPRAGDPGPEELSRVLAAPFSKERT